MANKSILEIIIGMKDQASGGLKGLLGNIKSFGDGVKKAFNSEPVRLFRNAVLAVSAAITGAIAEAAVFNIQVARVSTMGGGKFKELREQARGLASDFGLARSQIAGGMYNALSAGIDKANLKSFMATAAKVAVADGSDISVAVDGITTVLNAFKVKASETETVTDDLFQTVRQGKTTFGDLAANLATVAPIAAASEIPLKQILAHVATLTAQGTPTAQAMTQIRASIMGLNKALGDGWSGTMSYQDALKKVWQNAGQSQTELLKLVGSSEAVQAVLGGVGINAQMATDKLSAMANSAGAAEEAFKKVQEFRHWPTLIETARGTISKLGEKIDQRLHPYVVAVTAQLKKWRDDEGLWSTIGSFMDSAVAKLDSVAKQTGDIIKQIKSVEDLKVVAGVIGDWMKEKLIEAGHRIAAYLLEKAPMIGSAIGRAAWEAIKPGNKDSMTNDQVAAAREAATNGGQNRVYSREWRENYQNIRKETESANRYSRLVGEGKEASAQIEISDASQQSLADRITAALTAKQADSSRSDSDRLLSALENGLSGEALDKLVSGLELTAEDLELLAEYTEQFSTATSDTVEASGKSAESAKASAEAVTKAADAAVDSNTKVSAAMDRSKDASLAAAQAAQRNIQVTEQALALVGTLAGSLARLEQDVRYLRGQVNSMRS